MTLDRRAHHGNLLIGQFPGGMRRSRNDLYPDVTFVKEVAYKRFVIGIERGNADIDFIGRPVLWTDEKVPIHLISLSDDLKAHH